MPAQGYNAPRDIAALAITTTRARLISVAQSAANSAVRLGCYICPTDGTLYIGGATVTALTGVPVSAGSVFFIEWTHGANWYGIAASGTIDVRVVPIDKY